MIYERKEKPLGDIYIVEEDDNFRLGQIIDTGSIVLFIILFFVIQTFSLIYVADMLVNGIDVIKTICCGAVILFFTMCLIITLYNSLTYKNYSLIVSSFGIKNKTNKGIVMLPWNEFKQIGIVENVAIVGHRGYHSFIYLSNSKIDEKKLRKTIKDSQSQFYITTNKELVITISINTDKEMMLYQKIQQYIDKFNLAKTN